MASVLILFFIYAVIYSFGLDRVVEEYQSRIEKALRKAYETEVIIQIDEIMESTVNQNANFLEVQN